MMLPVMVKVATLTQRCKVKQAATAVRHIVYMRHSEDDFATCYWMRFVVLRAAPLTPVSRPVETHEATS